MQALMEKEASVPAIGTSPAVVAALRHFGAKKIAIATPYVEWNNAKLRQYMKSMGFDVLTLEGDPQAVQHQYSTLWPPHPTFRLGLIMFRYVCTGLYR